MKRSPPAGADSDTLAGPQKTSPAPDSAHLIQRLSVRQDGAPSAAASRQFTGRTASEFCSVTVSPPFERSCTLPERGDTSRDSGISKPSRLQIYESSGTVAKLYENLVFFSYGNII